MRVKPQIAPCSRCGNTFVVAAMTQDGPVCMSCKMKEEINGEVVAEKKPSTKLEK